MQTTEAKTDVITDFNTLSLGFFPEYKNIKGIRASKYRKIKWENYLLKRQLMLSNGFSL